MNERTSEEMLYSGFYKLYMIREYRRTLRKIDFRFIGEFFFFSLALCFVWICRLFVRFILLSRGRRWV